jgi:23S rRNA maturation mini-RNase III
LKPTPKLLREAWIGDAVLTLYARQRILALDGELDGSKSTRMTSNQFLSTLGEPTAVEAELGRLYQDHGLAAAFDWIEARVVPLFEKQEENRRRKGQVR